jgi:hypothetical protein
MASRAAFATGVAVGIGVKWLSPYLVPVLGALVSPITRLQIKPLARASVKAGWIGLERGRELFAYLGETVQDVFAEAREELVRAEKPAVNMEKPSVDLS